MNYENTTPDGIALPDDSQTAAINEWRLKSTSRRAAERGQYRKTMRRRLAVLAIGTASFLSPPGQALVDGITHSSDQDMKTQNQRTDDDLPPAGEVNPSDPLVVYGNTYKPPEATTTTATPFEGGPDEPKASLVDSDVETPSNQG